LRGPLNGEARIAPGFEGRCAPGDCPGLAMQVHTRPTLGTSVGAIAGNVSNGDVAPVFGRGGGGHIRKI
jgi:hypothetical protein